MRAWEIEAYRRWARADKLGLSKASGDRKSWTEYLSIFKAHCAKKAKPRSLHFGGEPEYGPRKEKIVEEVVDGKKAMVKTLRSNQGLVLYVTYHLIMEDRWRILKKYILFSDGPFLSEL